MPHTKFSTVDDCHASEIYAGGSHFFSLVRDADVIVTFTTPRWHPADNTAANHVVTRLAMPIRGAQELVLRLNEFLEQQGKSPAQALAATSAVGRDQEQPAPAEQRAA